MGTERSPNRPVRPVPQTLFPDAEATTGFEPVMGVLQTPALPLGYVAAYVNILAQWVFVVKQNCPIG